MKHYTQTTGKTPFIKRSWLRWSIIIGSILYLIAALSSMDINIQRVLEGIPRGQRFIESFFHLTFRIIVAWYGRDSESIWMAIISTVAGIALSIPIGLGAARNLAPLWVYMTCRFIIAASNIS